MVSFDGISKIFSGPRLPQLYHPEITIGQVLMYQSLKFRNKVMQINVDDGVEMTYREITDMMTTIAENLVIKSLKFGDVAGFCAKNSNLLTPTVLGCLLLGVSISPVTISLGVDEIAKIFKETKPKIIFCDSDQVKNIEKVLKVLEMNEVEILTMNESVEILLQKPETSQKIPQTFNTTSD